MWEYVLGGATVFGLIVTLGAWLNGRMTRKAIMQYFEKSDERFEELLKEVRRIGEESNRRFEEISKRFDDLIKQHNELVRQHNEILRVLSTRR